MQKVVYISGAMTGLPDLNRGAFLDAEIKIRNAGHLPLNPAVLPSGMERERYMPICLAMLEASDAIYMIPGWGNSVGASLEYAFAKYQGKEVLDGRL